MNINKYLIVTALVLMWTGCRSLESGDTSTPLRRTSTFAGSHREFVEPFGVAFRDGNLFVSDGDAGKILKVNAGGETTVFAQGLKTPSAIAFESEGDLVVADTGDNTIKRIDASGSVVVVAGVPGKRGDADGDAASATFNGPIGVAVGRDNRVLVADTYNDRIRVIEKGTVRTISGSTRGFADGPGSSAKFDTPTSLVELAGGAVVVCDSQNARLRLIEPDGTTSTLSGTGERESSDGLLDTARFTEPAAIAEGVNGDVYVADGDELRVIRNGAFPFVRTIAGGRRGFVDGGIGSAYFNRPSGLAFDRASGLFVADADNQVIRLIGSGSIGSEITSDVKRAIRYTAEEFRGLQPPRWPYDPPNVVREIAGTLGEIRGTVTPPESESHFHNGLDIAGGYGEQARFVRSEKVLLPSAAENFGTSRELIRMPTLGYIHVRLGRSSNDMILGDPRFQFTFDDDGRAKDVRVPRGTMFTAGEVLGTLNAMNHVHLIAGRSGAEINALAALDLPGVSDTISPVIESVEIFDENWRKNETRSPSNRIELRTRARVVVRGYDRVDGNAERRRLGVFKIGLRLTRDGWQPAGPIAWNIQFDRMPPADAVKAVYAPGSKSGATGETIFNYIATNTINGDGAAEGFIDPAALDAGNYTLEVFAADYFGNTTSKTASIEVLK